MADDAKNIWQQLGLPGGAGRQVKLERGVLGKTGPPVLAGMAVLAVVALRLSGTVPLLVVAGAVCLILLIYLGLAFGFAFQNPGAALLEGADLLAWQTLVSAAAKDQPAVLDSHPVSNPMKALPEPASEPVTEPTPSTGRSEANVNPDDDGQGGADV